MTGQRVKDRHLSADVAVMAAAGHPSSDQQILCPLPLPALKSHSSVHDSVGISWWFFGVSLLESDLPSFSPQRRRCRMICPQTVLKT